MPRPVLLERRHERTDSLPGLVEAFAALPPQRRNRRRIVPLRTAVDPISRRDAPAAAYRELFIGFCMIETAAEPGSSMPPQTGEAAAPDPQRSTRIVIAAPAMRPATKAATPIAKCVGRSSGKVDPIHSEMAARPSEVKAGAARKGDPPDSWAQFGPKLRAPKEQAAWPGVRRSQS